MYFFYDSFNFNKLASKTELWTIDFRLVFNDACDLR